MKTEFVFSAVVMSIMLLSSSVNAGSSGEAAKIQAETLFQQELLERELAHQLAPIKSETDLRRYQLENVHGGSPIRRLSKGAQERFLQSLVFTDSGLASFDYRDLRAELTATQVHEVLSLFGVQRTTRSIPGLRVVNDADAAIVGARRVRASMMPSVDYDNYWCESRATCRPSTGGICIGDNC